VNTATLYLVSLVSAVVRRAAGISMGRGRLQRLKRFEVDRAPPFPANEPAYRQTGSGAHHTHHNDAAPDAVQPVAARCLPSEEPRGSTCGDAGDYRDTVRLPPGADFKCSDRSRGDFQLGLVSIASEGQFVVVD
jgi:hypothetical protein